MRSIIKGCCDEVCGVRQGPRAAVMAMIAVLAGCSDERAPSSTTGDEPVATASSPIIGGSSAASIPFENRWILSGVVRLERHDEPTGNCSGTMIAQDLVVTAAHCLDIKNTCRDVYGEEYLCPGHEYVPYMGRIRIHFHNQNPWPSAHPLDWIEVPALGNVFVHPLWRSALNDLPFFDVAVIRIPPATVVTRVYANHLRVVWKGPDKTPLGETPTVCLEHLDMPTDPRVCNWYGHDLLIAGYGGVDARGTGLPWGDPPKAMRARINGLLPVQDEYNDAAMLLFDSYAHDPPWRAFKGDSGGPGIVGRPLVDGSAGTRDDWLWDEPTLVSVHSASYKTGPDVGYMKQARLAADATRDWFDEAGFLDLDGDGIPAHEDNCAYDSDNEDGDADGLSGLCDGCPYDFNPDQRDTDGDGVQDACDQCSGFDDHIDADGDGLPDQCDPCPCEAGDPDGDRICGCDPGYGGACPTRCAVDPGDNCPTVWNYYQENCNYDAESRYDARFMGDACDPVVCPQTLVAYDIETGGGPMIGYVHQELDHLELNPLGSSSTTEAGTFPEGEYEVAAVPTHYRYCRSLNGLLDCFLRAAVDEGELLIRLDHADEHWDDAWHRITIDQIPSPLDVPNPVDVREYLSSHLYSRTWDYESDWNRWLAAYGPAWPELYIPWQDSHLAPQGRLWTHGASQVGMVIPDTFGTGFHPDRYNPAVAVQRLANFYTPLDPVRTYMHLIPYAGPPKWMPEVLYCPWCTPISFVPDYRPSESQIRSSSVPPCRASTG